MRYAAAAAVIAAGCGGMALAFKGSAADEAASELGSAVMIDLPAEDASSRAESDAEEGPEQQAQAAAQAAPRPPENVSKDAEPPRPAVEDAGMPAVPPESDASTLAAPRAAAAARLETAPTGALMPDPDASNDGEDGRPHPTGHAITLWQRTLMKRLEGTRRRIAATRRGSGTVTVAFSIDERGALVAERVEKSSGSPAIDAAGLQLVQMAAPFPAPPSGSRGDDLSFAVPIRFR